MIREQDGERGWDIMSWDVPGGQAAWPMTNAREPKLPQLRKPAADSANRRLVLLTEFCEWTPDKTDLCEGKPPIKGEMWVRSPTGRRSPLPGSGSRRPKATASRW